MAGLFTVWCHDLLGAFFLESLEGSDIAAYMRSRSEGSSGEGFFVNVATSVTEGMMAVLQQFRE